MLFEKIRLETDEQIIKIVRRHWFWLFLRLGSLLISALVPLVAWAVIGNVSAEFSSLPFTLSDYGTEALFLYSVWLLFHWMSVAYVCTDYYLDLWAITDRRIIAVDQVALFRRSLGSFRLERLQDMNIEINGIIATLLHYGDIEAQTASGSEEEFQAQFIPNPREVKAIILRCADERMRTYNENSNGRFAT